MADWIEIQEEVGRWFIIHYLQNGAMPLVQERKIGPFDDRKLAVSVRQRYADLLVRRGRHPLVWLA
jgi:hypothetical protein